MCMKASGIIFYVFRLENLEQILNSNRVPLPDDPTVSESNSNVIPSLATVSSLEQAKWLVMYLTHEVCVI